MKYLKLIRYKNLLLIAFMQLIFRYGFLKFQNVPLALTNWNYLLLVCTTVLIAAGGYIINNILDQDTDGINKPSQVVVGKSISESTAYNMYIGVTFTGVAIGFYLSNVIAKPSFATLFILIAATLYLYATSLKQLLLIGNIIIALLLSFSVIIIGFFDLFPTTNIGNQQKMATVFSILLDYATFAFMINLLREIVKDLEDINGDYNQNRNTLPIFIGANRTTKIVFVLSFIPLFLLLNYINTYFVANNLALITAYSILFIIAPLIYFSVKIFTANKTKDFTHLSFILKLIICFGLLSIALLTYNIPHHA
jgi:4-hydroxybenzoate polyprenyltransferase